MSMLLERNPDGVTPAYQALLPLLTRPVGMWVTTENQLIAGNVPPLCRMLQAFIHRQASIIVEQDQIGPILGVYGRLVISNRHDNYGLELISALFEELSIDQIRPHLRDFLVAVFNRLQTNKTDNLCTSFITAISIFAGKHSPSEMVAAVEQVGPGYGSLVCQPRIGVLYC
jgi:exportin-2 (importin alpha re-exporter)